MKVDVRATNAIKIIINRTLKNKDSVNLDIAKCISSFSHSTILKYGSVFENIGSNFFIVNKINSPFWVEITHIPPVRLLLGQWGGYILGPHWRYASTFHRKKVFNPFSNHPYLKKRGKRYWFKYPLGFITTV